MLTRYPEVFTRDRIWVLDRNFPGADRVARMLATGTHVLIRVKSDLALPRIGGFLPDGSYYSYLTGGRRPLVPESPRHRIPRGRWTARTSRRCSA